MMFSDRIDDLCIINEDVKRALRKFPRILSFTPSDAVIIKFQSLITAKNIVYAADNVRVSVRCLWNKRQYQAAGHCVRLLVEFLGMICYINEKIIIPLESDKRLDVGALSAKMQRIMHGSKSKILLPAGITEKFEPINVMEFVRSGDRKYGWVHESYDFLCDFSHTTLILHTDMVLLRRGVSGNPLFDAEVTRILLGVTEAAELSVASIGSEFCLMYEKCLPDITAEIEEHGKS